ncbi:hypothetical protein Aduo_015963 [Ancylostoma duodenale]
MSYRSLQSSVASTRMTVETVMGHEHYAYYIYQKEPIAALKHNGIARLSNEDATCFRKMRQMENDNINRFIGICSDGPQVLSLWRLCTRGSISDVIMKGSMVIDSFFAFSLLVDITNGLSFIHHSFLRQHGYLCSECCFVDDRWQVKISEYGIDKLRAGDQRSVRDLLWTAPELLRNPSNAGTQEGDVYRLFLKFYAVTDHP